jgi:hypothetical protein
MPTEPTEQVDHKAEALTLLAEADTARLDRHRGHAKQLRAEAQIHSNLAIAEAQERVADELKRLVGGVAFGMRDKLHQALSEIVVAVKEGQS